MREGWTWAMDSLRSYLETGAPIPHEDWLKARKSKDAVNGRAAPKPATKSATKSTGKSTGRSTGPKAGLSRAAKPKRRTASARAAR
jgi:hypothetical protein